MALWLTCRQLADQDEQKRLQRLADERGLTLEEVKQLADQALLALAESMVNKHNQNSGDR